MNRNSLAVLGATLLIFSPALPSASRAQSPAGPDTTESTTSDSTGTVQRVWPGSGITVADKHGPFTYRLDLDMHIIGPDNHPLKISQIRPGDTVTVYWHYRDAYPTVARLVVLQRGSLAKK